MNKKVFNISYFPTKDSLEKRIIRINTKIGRINDEQMEAEQAKQVAKQFGDEKIAEYANERDGYLEEIKICEEYLKELEKCGDDPKEEAYVNGEIGKLRAKAVNAMVRIKAKVEETYFDEADSQAAKKQEEEMAGLVATHNENLDLYKKLYMPKKPSIKPKVIDFGEKKKEYDRRKEFLERPDFAVEPKQKDE
jgi:small-conductance mechanosensitive channel